MMQPSPLGSARLTWLSLRANLRQLMRYGIAGLLLNLAGYAIYLTATSLGLSPLATITIFYPLSVMAGYFTHRKYTFRHNHPGIQPATLARYIAVYVAGYLINAALLFGLSEKMGYPHQWVQAFSIFAVAGFLFIAMKWFVFSRSGTPARAPSRTSQDSRHDPL